LQSLVSLNIYNQCHGINLTSPVHFIHGGKWNVIPGQKIDASDVIRNCIEFDSEQDILEGALVYKIQRQRAESDEFVQDKSKSIQLLVVWHVERAKGSHVCAVLIEHDWEFNLNEDKLRRLRQKYWHSLKTQVKGNWLLDNATVLETLVKVMNGGYGLDVFISKEKGYGYAMRPLWIDAKR
jgi:hypothetical protein